ncbi:MAG: molybdopterin-dependent oxidoreductase [Dehalococcoidales bacterium]|nr:molybdopterin-dependent oxidoreductase [Dehalococcoidales bacterium]
MADVYKDDFLYVGKDYKRRDGPEKAAGTATYAADITLPNSLFAKVMTCPWAHAKIKKMDTSKAEKLEGVVDILRFDDPRIKGKMLNSSWNHPFVAYLTENVEHLKEMLPDEGFYDGEELGVVILAESENICEEAMDLVEVEWEQLPFILDPEDALKDDAYVYFPGRKTMQGNGNEIDGCFFNMGDVEKAFRESDAVWTVPVAEPMINWVSAEMPTCSCTWESENLTIYAHSQVPYELGLFTADNLGIPQSKVKVISPFSGGTFGERSFVQHFNDQGIAYIAAMLSKQHGRPVKFYINRADQFRTGRSQCYMHGEIKIGANKDGKINAVSIKNFTSFQRAGLWITGSAYAGYDHFTDNTCVPNVKMEGRCAVTSQPPGWWFRCEQNIGCYNLNIVNSEVAHKFGLDPIDVAIKNNGYEGEDVDHLYKIAAEHGLPTTDSLKACIATGKKAFKWDEKLHADGAKKLPNGRYHGIGFVWDHAWNDNVNTITVGLALNQDGSVNIIGQRDDLGTNDRTSYSQLAAECIGIPYEMVNYRCTDTYLPMQLKNPGGSMGIISQSRGIMRAAKKLRAEIFAKAESLKVLNGIKADEMDLKEGYVFEAKNPSNRIHISEVAATCLPYAAQPWGVSCKGAIMVYDTNVTKRKWGYPDGGTRPRFARQCHFLEIEVDPDTGEIFMGDLVTVNDVGVVISPKSCKGQGYGGAMQGLGRAYSEEYIYDKTYGVLLNPDLQEYKIVTMLDFENAESYLEESHNCGGEWGCGGIGEDVATLIPCILTDAVRNALGVSITEQPITPDKILKALGKVK